MMSLLKDKAFINGEWVSAGNKSTFEIRNPINGEVIANVPDMDATDAERAVKAASEAFKTWQTTTGQERSTLLRKWGELLSKNSDEIGNILARETGKVQIEATMEAKGLPPVIEYYSEQTKRIHGEIISSPVPGKKLLVERQPLGVVALITPWNVPLFQSIRKIVTALAGGCTCVLKPAEDAPLATLAAIQFATEAGIPKGVVNVVTCDRKNASAIGKVLCQSPLVAGLSFTGSVVVGKILYEQCAPFVKRVSLEMGGNSPFIVFESADVEKAVQFALVRKFMNAGQICVSPNRFLIHVNLYEEFVKRFSESMTNIKPGVSLGPIINATQFNRLNGLVEDARSKGANILLGGKPASDVGQLFYEPTLITNVTKDMRIYSEEIFGPVASVMTFETEEEAVAIANDTEKGLSAYFCSQDISQIFRVGRLLESGVVYINESIASLDAPFGGIKESGIGKEGSRYSIDEFTYMKYICIGNL